MKSLDYLVIKRPVLQVHPHIALLCEGLQNHLIAKFGSLSDTWDSLAENASQEEHLAHNTHTNAMFGAREDEPTPAQTQREQLLHKLTDGKKGKKKNVGWTDVQGEGQQLATVIDTLEMEEVEDPKDLA